MENKKPLLRMKELKQYFPIRGKRGVFVKANDGVSLEIYQGETLGIVGESGCGKSTLGRTLLQLYNQTDGQTMYYGMSLEDLAPVYVLDIYKNLEKRCKTAKHELEQLEKLEKEYAALEEKLNSPEQKQELEDLIALEKEYAQVTKQLKKASIEAKDQVPALKKQQADLVSRINNSPYKDKRKQLYAKMDQRNNMKRIANRDFMAIVRLVGGFYAAKDYATVSKIYTDYYKTNLTIKDINKGLSKLSLKIAELEYDIANNKEGADATKLEALKVEHEKISATTLQDAIRQREAKQAEVDALRATYANDADFQNYEQYREDGIDLTMLTKAEMRDLRKDLQLIFQDPYSSLNPRFTVGQILSEGPMIHGELVGKNERAQDYITNIMEDCGLAPYMMHRYPHQFSGGQRQRISIARALSVKPKFVVCDEAVSALDVSIQSQIINLLQDLKEKENLTYMFISHDLSVVKYISDRIAVMYLGNLVELCTSEELFTNALHPYTEALLSAIPTTDIDEDKKDMIILEGDIPSPVNPPKGCKFHTRCPKKIGTICEMVEPVWVEQCPGHFVACHKYTYDPVIAEE